MRRWLTLVVLSGCASGTSSNAPIDSNGGSIDAPAQDASQIDAAPNVDAAPNIDAAPPIDAPPDACVPMVTELLGNPNFDNAAITPWTEIRFDATIPLIDTAANLGFAAQTPTKYTWLGGYEAILDDAPDYVYQNIVIPPLTSQIVVTGYMAIGTSDTFPQADAGLLGFLFPNAPSTPPIIIVSKTNSDAASFNMWTPFAQTIVTPLSGQTLRFQMESHNDFLDATSFLFDSVSVKATHGCP